MAEEINDRSKEDVPSIYEGDLSYKTLKENPILKPISVINNSYVNFELIIRRALWEFEQDKKKIDALIEANPKYSETILLGRVQSILSHIKSIIHSQDCQKDNMREAINEMLKIVSEEYAPLDEDYVEETKGTKFEKEPEETSSMDETPEEPEEEEEIQTPIPEEVEKKDIQFSSSLLDKKIEIPSDEGFIPIKKLNKIK